MLIVLLLVLVAGGIGVLYTSGMRSLYISEQCKMVDEVYALLLEQDIPQLCEEENRIKERAEEDEWEEQTGSLLEPYENNNLRFRIRDENFDLLYATNKMPQSEGGASGSGSWSGFDRQRMLKYSDDARAVYEKSGSVGRVILRGRHVLDGVTYYIMITESTYVIDRSADYAEHVLLIVLLVFLLLGTVCVRILARGIGRPVADAARIARKIADKDFSERIEGQTKYQELNELGESINEMSDQLQNYIRDLETYNRLLQEDNQRRAELEQHRKRFVNNVSHELKTPLAIISGQTELLSLSRDDEKRQQYCASVLEEVNRMSDMLSSMLQIFSVEESMEHIPMERLDFGAAAAAAVQDFMPLFASRELRVEQEYADNCYVMGNAENLRRAVSNYLMNAFRYTPEDGLIRVSVAPSNQYVLFMVYNEGSAIGEREMDKIWDRFYRGESAEDENRPEGTGLGLYIVKSIVLQHGGVYGAENKNHGVEFWFGITRSV